MHVLVFERRFGNWACISMVLKGVLSMDWGNGGITGVLAIWEGLFFLGNHRIDTLSYPTTLGQLEILQLPFTTIYQASFYANPAALIRFSIHRRILSCELTALNEEPNTCRMNSLPCLGPFETVV